MAVSAGCVALMGMDWVLEMDPEETKYLKIDEWTRVD